MQWTFVSEADEVIHPGCFRCFACSSVPSYVGYCMHQVLEETGVNIEPYVKRDDFISVSAQHTDCAQRMLLQRSGGASARCAAFAPPASCFLPDEWLLG